MATTADFKNGMCLDIDGQYFFIVEFLHVKPGKGPAFVRTKLRNVKTGRILEKTWNSGVKVEEVRIERRPTSSLYKDDMGYNFMHTETFEQVALPGESIEGVEFLKKATSAKPGSRRFRDHPHLRDAHFGCARSDLHRTRHQRRYCHQHPQARYC